MSIDDIDFDNFFTDSTVFTQGPTLHVDADSIIYAAAVMNNDDSDYDRSQIQRAIRAKVNVLTQQAGCGKAVCFLTPKTNFRNYLVDDYKGNRKDTVRPVNLPWGKQWIALNMENRWLEHMEADDMLGVYASDDSIIWSLDKDLRQIPGRHLDDKTGQIKTITQEGTLVEDGKKVYFDGDLGFYFQMLTGDNADHIIGCGIRVEGRRKGIGPKKALSMLQGNSAPLETVIRAYEDLHGDYWQAELETQANLLFMVREMPNDHTIKQWTYDGRDSYMNLKTGEITNVPDES
jgi:DNA polymerase-1